MCKPPVVIAVVALPARRVPNEERRTRVNANTAVEAGLQRLPDGCAGLSELVFSKETEDLGGHARLLQEPRQAPHFLLDGLFDCVVALEPFNALNGGVGERGGG